MVSVIDVNTGELLFEGSFEDAMVYMDYNNYVWVNNKRLFSNYGFTDDNVNNMYVVR